MFGKMCCTVIRPDVLAGGAGGEDEFARPQRQRAAARDAGEDRNVEDADGDDGVDRAGAEDRGDHHRRQQGREGEDDVGGAHQHLVGDAAFCRRPAAERHADGHTDADRDQRHGDGIAAADHDHGEDVAAEMVGAEPVGGVRGLQPVGDDQFGHVIGRPDEREKRDSDDEDGDQRAGEERAVGERLSREMAPVLVFGRDQFAFHLSVS
jgi:hypothetical protein